MLVLQGKIPVPAVGLSHIGYFPFNHDTMEHGVFFHLCFDVAHQSGDWNNTPAHMICKTLLMILYDFSSQ